MNTLNRIFLVLLCLALIAGAIAVTVLAWGAPDESIERLREGVDWLEDNNDDFEKVVLTAIAAGVGLVALIVLLFELLPRSSPNVKVSDLRVGSALLSTAAIGQRVEEAVEQVPHVADARAQVKTKKKGVQVSLDLHVDPEANLATVADEACDATRDVLTNRIHVELVDTPRVRLHYRELRLGRNATRRPAVETPPPPAQPVAVAEPAVATMPPFRPADVPPPVPERNDDAEHRDEAMRAEERHDEERRDEDREKRDE
jgi:hypothetical protein